MSHKNGLYYNRNVQVNLEDDNVIKQINNLKTKQDVKNK